MFEVAILSSLNYSPQVSASGEESSFWLWSCASLKAQLFAVLRAWTTDAERGWDQSVYMCVEKHSRGYGRKLALAKIRSRHREHASLRNANAPPALNARLALQAPRRMGACEFQRSSITCLRVPGANSWSWLRELRVNRGLGLSYCEC